MATAQEYAQWIVANKDKRGSPDFETVAKAYEAAKRAEGLPMAEGAPIPTGGPAAPAYTGKDPEMARLQAGGAAPTTAQKVRGAAELLNVPFALAGGVVGGVAGAGEALLTGKPVMDTAALRAGQGAVGMSPIPPTQAGQELMGNIAGSDAVAQLQALGPAGMVSSLGTRAVGAGMSTAGQMAPVVAREALQAAKPAVARAVEAMRPAAAKPAQAAGGSVGAAGADVAAMRRERAAQLGIADLTEGQATGAFDALQFEKETAKNAKFGQPLRERIEQQTSDIQRKLDSWFDETEAITTDDLGAGKILADALQKGGRRAKAEERLKYRKAELAGEMEGPVQLDSIVDYLNGNKAATVTSPILRYAKSKAVELGVAEVGENGRLVALPTPLKTSELLRQGIRRETSINPSDQFHAGEMRKAIDASTETAGGQLYKEARAAHMRNMQNFENVGLIDAAMSLKRNTSDRKIAFEDIFKKLVLNSSRDELGQVRRVLQTHAGPEGEQAWKEMRGATMRWIKEQSLQDSTKTESGLKAISVSGMNKAVKTLDQDRKLEFIFGKNNAQKVRDLNDLVRDVYLAPPGAVSRSDTPSIMAMLVESGLMGMMSGVPVPVMTIGKQAVQQIKDRKLRARIEQALGKVKTSKDKKL
jgi:hypothetical protein